MTPVAWLLLAPAVAAAAVDLRSRRIPNRVVGPGLCCVLVASWLEGILGPAAGGMAIAGVAGLAARSGARGAFGAGDVKLLAYSGAATGLGGAGSLLLATAAGGGLLGAGYLVARGRAASVPYGVAITFGLVVSLAITT